ncbi:uncharacterized protein si:dkey-237j10.2 [Xyrichtys novacula]|uniref:Uncharacterized protein si:dkey-237j10.2 n=1 Tax=Xyrichtys novacula TaxID=13765 RepID=A0AAV1FB76_XYRNO|nr:uncharacterized protein si:dkey-237j10.2 [Xyrichtys novacula]
MLAEGFLRALHYREERKLTSDSKLRKSQTCSPTEPKSCTLSDSSSTDSQTDAAEAGPDQKELDPHQFQGPRVMPQGSSGLFIPGSSPALQLDPDFPLCLEDCSLLEQYPDLQVADSGRISQNPRVILTHNALPEVSDRPEWSARQELRGEPVTSIPDQGYLVMGASVNTSLDLPGSRLEPMSNSVLNGLLEKQLEEVYMQHLTDNLARCNSNFGNSLLHGLVPPPQPRSQLSGPDSLDVSLEESANDSSKKISYLNTHNLAPCSSNFSSPVLRISEADTPHLQ